MGDVQKVKQDGRRIIWQACRICGKERWVEIRKGRPQNLQCRSCAITHENKKRRIPTEGLKRAVELGKKGTALFVESGCAGCGKVRWVRISQGIVKSLYCRSCTNRATLHNRIEEGGHGSCWSGGRWKDGSGYIKVWIGHKDFFAPMVNSSGYVAEHRLVIARHLGRCLHPWEIVHHKNGVKDDNRIENLELTMGFNHMAQHKMEYRIKQLEARVTFIEAENAALRGKLWEKSNVPSI